MTSPSLPALLAAGTVLPLRLHGYSAEVVSDDEIVANCNLHGTRVSGGSPEDYANAALIVAAVNALPSHLARIAELEAGLREALDSWEAWDDARGTNVDSGRIDELRTLAQGARK